MNKKKPQSLKHSTQDLEHIPIVCRHYKDVYTGKQKPICNEWMKRLAADFIKWTQEDNDALILRDFCHLKGIPERMFYRWIKKYPVMAEAHKEALSRVGSRREKGAIKKVYDSKAIMSRMHVYDVTWKEDEEWRNEMKIKASNVNQGPVSYTVIVDDYSDDKKEKKTTSSNRGTDSKG